MNEMPDPEFMNFFSKLEDIEFGAAIRPIINRFIQNKANDFLDVLLDLATSEKDRELRRHAEDALYKIGEIPEYSNLLVRHLLETGEIRHKELLARLLQRLNDPSIVGALTLVSEQHKNNFRLRESAISALILNDRRKAREYCLRVKINIVVADDEPDMRDLLCYILTLENWTVLSAHNGEMAYEFTKISVPDIVLSDVRMPRMTGYETCRKIKADVDVKHIPVVLFSAKGQQSEIEQGLAAGATEYLTKPISADHLTYRLRTIMRNSRLGIYNEQN